MTLPYSIVAGELESAKTRSALLISAENIQYVDGIDLRERLGAIVKRRLEEFKKAE